MMDGRWEEGDWSESGRQMNGIGWQTVHGVRDRAQPQRTPGSSGSTWKVQMPEAETAGWWGEVAWVWGWGKGFQFSSVRVKFQMPIMHPGVDGTVRASPRRDRHLGTICVEMLFKPWHPWEQPGSEGRGGPV